MYNEKPTATIAVGFRLLLRICRRFHNGEIEKANFLKKLLTNSIRPVMMRKNKHVHKF